MVVHCSDMQDLSQHTILRCLTGHHTTIMSLPLLLLLDKLHWTHHTTALPILMLSLLHTCTCVAMLDAETPTGLHSTITSSLWLPYPSIHHAGIIIIHTDGLVTAYTHSYRDTRPAPSQHQVLGHDTDCPVMVILAHCCICTARRRHLQFHMATTSRSGPPESTLTQH
jgi:hypothetical protein